MSYLFANAYAVHNCTGKKENKIFLKYKEIQSGVVAKTYMRKGFLIYEEMRKYFAILKRLSVSYLSSVEITDLKSKQNIFFQLTISLIYISENPRNFRTQKNKRSIQSSLIQQPSVFGVDL
jgi:hypothetical protein